MITRRRLLQSSLMLPAATASPEIPPVVVPVLRIRDENAALTAEELKQFDATVWTEAVDLFRRSGVEVRTSDRSGSIGRYPTGRPRFAGLERGSVNVVLTRTVPLAWSEGRGLSGVTTIYEGFHVSVLALSNAHANRVPVLAVNTVVHELLHVLRGDIFARKAGWLKGADREAAVDWQATHLWFMRGAPHLREYAAGYVKRLHGRIA